MLEKAGRPGVEKNDSVFACVISSLSVAKPPAKPSAIPSVPIKTCDC
jgi:hypothetical protein